MITSTIYFCVKLGLLQLYPAYICYKAVKINNQQEFGSLLTFWIVSITYLSVEYFSDIFLFWIPFYTEFKLVVVLWLILPQTQGTSVFYTRYLDPFLHSNEEHIDNALLEIQAKLKETIVLYGKKLIDSTKRFITDAVFKGHEVEQETTQSFTAEQAQKSEKEAAAIDNGRGGYIINPYSLFSSLITTAANRYQQQNKQDTPSPPSPSQATVTVEAPTPITSSGTTVTTKPAASAAAEDNNNNKLERTDSHDSLQSYVNIKEGSSVNTTPDLSGPKQTGSEASGATWGGYLASWMKKPSSSSVIVTEDKKQD